jgi:hypothetical protein
MIGVADVHGLRKLVSLKWDQANFGAATMRICRATWSVTLKRERPLQARDCPTPPDVPARLGARRSAGADAVCARFARTADLGVQFPTIFDTHRP